MSVPGVSGGTMAIILGIYDRLISSISNFKDIKEIQYFYKILYRCRSRYWFTCFVIKWLLDIFPFQVSFFS